MKIEARNTKSLRVQEDCFTQVSYENEGRVTHKLFQEFSKMGSCILSALSQPVEFDHKPQAWAQSRPVPETSRNLIKEIGRKMEDRSKNETHREWESL